MKILKKKLFTVKISLGEAHFPPLVKANFFEKHLKQKRCTISHFNVPNFVYLNKNKKKNFVVKCKKNVIKVKIALNVKIASFEKFLLFLPSKFDFFKLINFFLTFYGFNVFQNFNVDDFLPILKSRKKSIIVFYL